MHTGLQVFCSLGEGLPEPLKQAGAGYPLRGAAGTLMRNQLPCLPASFRGRVGATSSEPRFPSLLTGAKVGGFLQEPAGIQWNRSSEWPPAPPWPCLCCVGSSPQAAWKSPFPSSEAPPSPYRRAGPAAAPSRAICRRRHWAERVTCTASVKQQRDVGPDHAKREQRALLKVALPVGRPWVCSLPSSLQPPPQRGSGASAVP